LAKRHGLPVAASGISLRAGWLIEVLALMIHGVSLGNSGQQVPNKADQALLSSC
jgi:hypothetical protein